MQGASIRYILDRLKRDLEYERVISEELSRKIEECTGELKKRHIEVDMFTKQIGEVHSEMGRLRVLINDVEKELLKRDKRI